MSADTTDRRTNTELRRMDEAEAKQLPHTVYERWESLNDHLDRAEETRQEWQDIEQDATDILVNADMSAAAVELDLFGNDVAVYYDPEDSRVRSVFDDLEDVLDIDIDDADDIEASADDIDDEAIPEVKGVLADFIGLSLREWNGHDWGELSVAEREHIKTQIGKPQPDGWGLVGLMDALNEIIVGVEENRDERLGRVEKFRNAERRGDR